ncbi:MAG TPA: hypothetical protein VI959_01895 [Alphaproteobacteria bacterium]|nr:hypothetical protein [Alphaproteobacteria bacterium]
MKSPYEIPPIKAKSAAPEKFLWGGRKNQGATSNKKVFQLDDRYSIQLFYV